MFSNGPSSSNSSLIKAAFLLQLLLLIYLQVIEWVDLFPWNDIRKGNGQEILDIALGGIIIVALYSTYRLWRLGIWIAILTYIIWFVLQIMTFWIPYISGASEQWVKIHKANFTDTIQWLPTYDNHLPPDASHFLLQFIILVSLIAVIMVAYRMRKLK